MLEESLVLRREKNNTSPNATERLILTYRAAIVDSASSWCTEDKYYWRLMDARNFIELLTAFVSVVFGQGVDEKEVV